MKLIKTRLCCLLLLLFNSFCIQGQINLDRAVFENDYIGIEELLQEGLNPFTVESSKSNLIEAVVATNNIHLLDVILKNTQALSVANIYTIFSIAINKKQLDFVKYLLETDTHKSIDDISMYNLVALATQHDNVDIYELLIKHLPNIDNAYMDFLSMAIISNRFDVFQSIFKNKNIKISERFDDNERNSLVSQAANSPLILTFLINQNADVNTPNIKGETALHLTNNLTMAKLLVKKGANVNALDNQNHTPLYYAKQQKDIDMIQFLESVSE
ncbi:MAG: ankyrin repeat domain-containing protein [Chitinophagales bacterium]